MSLDTSQRRFSTVRLWPAQHLCCNSSLPATCEISNLRIRKQNQPRSSESHSKGSNLLVPSNMDPASEVSPNKHSYPLIANIGFLRPPSSASRPDVLLSAPHVGPQAAVEFLASVLACPKIKFVPSPRCRVFFDRADLDNIYNLFATATMTGQSGSVASRDVYACFDGFGIALSGGGGEVLGCDVAVLR